MPTKSSEQNLFLQLNPKQTQPLYPRCWNPHFSSFCCPVLELLLLISKTCPNSENLWVLVSSICPAKHLNHKSVSTWILPSWGLIRSVSWALFPACVVIAMWGAHFRRRRLFFCCCRKLPVAQAPGETVWPSGGKWVGCPPRECPHWELHADEEGTFLTL